MKASRLKTLALILWGSIMAISALLGLAVFAQPQIRTQLIPASGTLRAAPSQTAPTPSPSPAFFYLPSATARYATQIAATPSPVTGPGLVPILQYSVTLSADADPLTGLKPAQPENLNRRPIAVKVSTFPRGIVRPNQYGLMRADLVYEYYIEDGLTRFIAVFYGQDAARAGPVRSGRYFDEYVMRMYRSSLVFANADERVEKHLLESELKPLLFLPRDDNCPPLCRDTSIQGYNNVFVDTAGVGPKLTDNSHQTLRATFFGELMYPQALPAIQRIYTHYSIYSYNYWEYDPLKQVYWRFSDTADASSFKQGESFGPHIDNLNGAQLSTQNVVELIVPHIFHNEFDRADQVFDITLTGSGPAYLFRDGRMLKANWIRELSDQPLRLEDADGRPVPIKPGTTFYQVINPESSIQQNAGNMDFSFFTPPLTVTPTSTPFGFEPTPTPRKSHK